MDAAKYTYHISRILEATSIWVSDLGFAFATLASVRPLKHGVIVDIRRSLTKRLRAP
jgi:hypothetical protein